MKNEVSRILYAISKDIIVGIIQIVPFFALCYLFNQMENTKKLNGKYSPEGDESF